MSGLDRLLEPMRRQVRNLVARAVVSLVNDGAKMQTLQLGVLKGETRETVERFQNYGLTSVPLAGAECVVLFRNGVRDHPLAIAVDDRRYRPTGLEAGEVELYHYVGDYIRLKNGRIIEVVAGAKVTVTAPEIEITGNVKIVGNVDITGAVAITGGVTATEDVVASGISLVNHTHPGIEPGAGSTGAPQ